MSGRAPVIPRAGPDRRIRQADVIFLSSSRFNFRCKSCCDEGGDTAETLFPEIAFNAIRFVIENAIEGDE